MSAKELCVRDFMTREVVTLDPRATVGEAARVLAEHRVSGAPVVDGGRILGVVSRDDLVREELSGRTTGEAGTFFTDVGEYRDLANMRADWARTSLQQVMHRDVVTVSADAPIALAARTLRERRIHRLLVTENGALAGILSALDLLRALED